MCRTQSVLVIALIVRLAHSWDIAVTVTDRIEFYTIDGTKTDTVHFNSQNLTALAYDEVHNMLLYVNKQSDNDSICGYNIAFEEYKCYIESQGRNIQGLAFDPVTESLFFTDTNERSINWFSFKPGAENNVNGNLLIKMDDGIPTDIAVDSCRGYIYWINTNLPTSTIERARLNGSERVIIVNATSKLDLHSLAIDQHAQKIYWKMPTTSLENYVYNADFDGKNMKDLFKVTSTPGDIIPVDHPNALIVLKQSFLMVDRCSSCDSKPIYKIKPYSNIFNYEKIIHLDTRSGVGIASNYKIKKQFHGIEDCKNVPFTYRTNDSFKIAREYEGPFCVHGIKVSGHSLCQCVPGYTGVRCETSVCENYCLQGNCSFTEEGLPKCRCYSGYTGERCEVDVCRGYCLNNGTCSLNEEEEPVCECKGQYEGERCEVPVTLNEAVQPVCQCVDRNEGSGINDDHSKSISNTPMYYLDEGNLTLADLLEIWQKPVEAISVVVEVKSNN